MRTQERRIIEAFLEEGKVSRNHFLDLPYDKITRLSGIILRLRKKGWDIETFHTKRDTIYRVNKYCVGYQEAQKEI